MANYQTLKAAINAVIKANGNKEITGTVLNEVLLAMVNSLGAGYQFAGVATPSTNPGTPDQKVFYIASHAGTYINFNGAVVSDGIAIFEWNGIWTTETLDLPILEQVQSDWTEDDTTKKSYIKHKPNIPEEQVQSDWTEDDTTKKSYIKHKPNIPPSANVDPVPTEDSPNAVSSGGVYDVTNGTLKTRYIPFDLRGESIIFLSDEDMTELFGPATMVGGQSMFDLTVGQYQHIYRVTNSKSEVFEIPAAYSNVNGARKIVGINGNLTIELSFTITNGVYVNAAIAKRETSIPGISYEEEQDLTAAQRRTAQQNIGLEKGVAGGVASLNEHGFVPQEQTLAVRFNEQPLTDSQQVQAQNNIEGKTYNPVMFSGLGKKILAKHIQLVDNVQQNVMTQAFFEDGQGNPLTNTVFVIKYDFTLIENITVPANCVLEFDGGSIDGGTNNYSLIDNYNTEIVAPNVKIFGENITLSGNWNIEGHITWFGASPLNDDNTAAIQKAFDSFEKVIIDKGNYITDALVMTKARMVYSLENEVREVNGFTFVFKTSNKTGLKVQRYENNPYYKLENVGLIIGNLPPLDRDHPYIDGTVGVDITDSSNYSQPIYCYDCKFIGFEIAVKSDNHSYYNKFVRCYFTRLKYGLYWISPNGTLVDSCIASFFERFYSNGAGLGPLNIINSNFEQFKGSILYSGNTVYHLNFENNYVESPKGNCIVGRFMNIVSKGNMIEVEKAFGTIYWMYASESIISIGNYIRIDDGCVEGLDPSAPQIPSFKYFDVYTGEPGQEAIYTDKLVLAHLEDTAYVPINPNPETPDTEGRYFNLENYIKYRAKVGFDNKKTTSIIIGRDPISGNGYEVIRKAIKPTVGNGYYYAQDGRYASCHYGDCQLSFIGVLSKTDDIISEGQRNIATIDMTSFATPGRFAYEYLYFKAMDSDYNPVILKLNLASTGDNSPFGSIDYIKGDTTKDILLDGCVINLF